MACRRCPHHVRHGRVVEGDVQKIEFQNMCGLNMKANEGKGTADDRCVEYPFSGTFDYMGCPVYLGTFKSGIQKNGVVPTRDFLYSEALTGGSITDLELL